MRTKTQYVFVTQKRIPICAIIWTSIITQIEALMSTISLRATSEFLEQTQHFAEMLGLKSSDYVREAIREKNERVMAERLAMLSRKLSAKHLSFNQSLDESLGDGLA